MHNTLQQNQSNNTILFIFLQILVECWMQIISLRSIEVNIFIFWVLNLVWTLLLLPVLGLVKMFNDIVELVEMVNSRIALSAAKDAQHFSINQSKHQIGHIWPITRWISDMSFIPFAAQTRDAQCLMLIKCGFFVSWLQLQLSPSWVLVSTAACSPPPAVSLQTTPLLQNKTAVYCSCSRT